MGAVKFSVILFNYPTIYNPTSLFIGKKSLVSHHKLQRINIILANTLVYKTISYQQF